MPVIHDDPGLLIPFVSREEWAAMPAKVDDDKPLQALEVPVPYVRYTSTGTEKCNTTDHCLRLIKDLQERDIKDHNLPDLRYNFVVGGDGKVYEGRGWAHDAERPPAYDKFKGKCIDIAYFGNYVDEHPKWEMQKVGLDVLKHGLKHKHVSPNFEIIPYRDDNVEKKEN